MGGSEEKNSLGEWERNGAEQELELAKESSFGVQSFGRYQGIKAQEQTEEWISVIGLKHSS